MKKLICSFIVVVSLVAVFAITGTCDKGNIDMITYALLCGGCYLVAIGAAIVGKLFESEDGK